MKATVPLPAARRPAVMHRPTLATATFNSWVVKTGNYGALPGFWGAVAVARSKHSWNSHQLRVRELPHVARFHPAGSPSARPAGWYATAGWATADVDFRLYRFATAAEAEAEAMQRWIVKSGIEARPAPEPYRGPQLGVAGGTTR